MKKAIAVHFGKMEKMLVLGILYIFLYTLLHKFRLVMTLKKKAFENIVRKGENAGNQHFLLFPQCFLSFSKLISNFGIEHYIYIPKIFPFYNFDEKGYCSSFWKNGENVGIGHFIYIPLLFTAQFRLVMTLKKKAFENIVRKGENAGNQHFLLFAQCFLPFAKQISIF